MKTLSNKLLSSIGFSPQEQQRYQLRNKLENSLQQVSEQLLALSTYLYLPTQETFQIEDTCKKILLKLSDAGKMFKEYTKLRKDALCTDKRKDLKSINDSVKECQERLEMFQKYSSKPNANLPSYQTAYEQIRVRLEHFKEDCENFQNELKHRSPSELLRIFQLQVVSNLSQSFIDRIRKIIYSEIEHLSPLERLNEISVTKMQIMEPSVTWLDGKFQYLFNKPQELACEAHKQGIENSTLNMIISRLAIWKELDHYEQDLKQQIQFPEMWIDNPTPARGRKPVENFFESIDNDRMLETMQQIHQKMYNESLEQSAKKSVSPPRTYLVCFLLALYKNHFGNIWGKITAYFNCLRDVCKFSFLTSLRTLQNWIKGYDEYRSGLRLSTVAVQRKYQSWEKQINEIYSYFPEDIMACAK